MFNPFDNVFTVPAVERCPSGYVYNPKTDTCVRVSEIPALPCDCNGRSICPKEFIYDKKLGYCIADDRIPMVPQRCPPNFIYNPKTGTCTESGCPEGYEYIGGGFGGGYYHGPKCVKVNPATVGPDEVCPECPEKTDDFSKLFLAFGIGVAVTSFFWSRKVRKILR